jgi:hypothetical protein
MCNAKFPLHVASTLTTSHNTDRGKRRMQGNQLQLALRLSCTPRRLSNTTKREKTNKTTRNLILSMNVPSSGRERIANSRSKIKHNLTLTLTHTQTQTQAQTHTHTLMEQDQKPKPKPKPDTRTLEQLADLIISTSNIESTHPAGTILVSTQLHGRTGLMVACIPRASLQVAWDEMMSNREKKHGSISIDNMVYSCQVYVGYMESFNLEARITSRGDPSMNDTKITLCAEHMRNYTRTRLCTLVYNGPSDIPARLDL